MKRQVHTKRIKIILAAVAGIVLATFVAFMIYVSIYYKAETYTLTGEYKDIIVKEYDGYVVYGDLDNSDTGIIFYPGGKVEAKAYEPLMYEFANENICCVLVEMPFNLAVFGINRADEAIEFNEEMEWYIAGHSLGGAMASGYAADNLDKLEGLILLSSYPTQELPENFPVISLYGSEDGVLDINKYNDEKSLASNFTEIIIEGGNHAGFGNYGSQSGDGTSKITNEEQWQITVEKVIEWIKKND